MFRTNVIAKKIDRTEFHPRPAETIAGECDRSISGKR